MARRRWPGRLPGRSTGRPVRRQPIATAALVILGGWLLVALSVPLVAPYDPPAQSPDAYAPPSGTHWFGTGPSAVTCSAGWSTGREFTVAPGPALRYAPVRADVPVLVGTWGQRTARTAAAFASEIKVGGAPVPTRRRRPCDVSAVHRC
ncbi:hypothetical protein KBX06_21925 [Micromonospora sp. C31]|uniref:hypothetical protein n=1 Tax=Micromonospora sp. C31 TaxID=2824876 RepID=UPI001B35BBBE|nr:hypothetical protein [Micromonospora sp. C31]MBQ1075796.1 hypothetical protein [Micromonospora sp. C31]